MSEKIEVSMEEMADAESMFMQLATCYMTGENPANLIEDKLKKSILMSFVELSIDARRDFIETYLAWDRVNSDDPGIGPASFTATGESDDT